MDDVTAGLITELESLKLRVCAIEDALLGFSGFKKTDDSPQGKIVFESPKQPLPVGGAV